MENFPAADQPAAATAAISPPPGLRLATRRIIHKTDSRLRWPDRLGAWKARWSIGRMHFTVQPGLYALGEPHEDSPVLVSANYRMSFDVLRSALPDRAVWILVLDTKGINVWCAAGKGTFGTDELVRQLEQQRLGSVVKHRELIVPQLGAPGISAPEVKQRTGFTVRYGPVRAADLPAYLDSGKRKTAAMRDVRFDFTDRIVLTPLELTASAPWAGLSILFALLLSLPIDANFQARLGPTLSILLSGWLGGALLFPLLLPYLPFKAFALKGLSLAIVLEGAVWIASLGAANFPIGNWHAVLLPMLSASFLALPFSVYLAMNFTGASTYTSPTGALQEVKHSLPWLIGSVAASLACAAAYWISRGMGV